MVQFTYVGISETLDHRGIVLSDPIGALAHLQLGRAYALAGNETKAKSASSTRAARMSTENQRN